MAISAIIIPHRPLVLKWALNAEYQYQFLKRLSRTLIFDARRNTHVPKKRFSGVTHMAATFYRVDQCRSVQELINEIDICSEPFCFAERESNILKSEPLDHFQ